MKLSLDFRHLNSRYGKRPAEAVDFADHGVRVVLVGLGGTGGFVFYHLARLAAFLPHKDNIQVVLCDGDIVEMKNLSRQNFVKEDLRRYKVSVLAERYGNIYNLNFPCFTEFVEDEKTLGRLLFNSCSSFQPSLSILVGEVDNNATRRVFNQAFEEAEEPLIYIDGGIDEWSGQVILGAKGKEGKVLLPPVTHYYPDILSDTDLLPSEIPCSERAVSAPQNMATNVMAGFLTFSLLNLLLTGQEITTCGTTFNARSGQSRALYLDEVLAAYPKKDYPYPYFLGC